MFSKYLSNKNIKQKNPTKKNNIFNNLIILE